MKRLMWLSLLFLLIASRAGSQEQALKYFEGRWEGTVKYFNPKGMEMGKYKARRILSFAGADTLRGSIEYQLQENRSQKNNLEIIGQGKSFILRQPKSILQGSFKERTFTFTGRDDNLKVDIQETHFFVAEDQEFFTLYQIDPVTKKKTVYMRGVLKLKKD